MRETPINPPSPAAAGSPLRQAPSAAHLAQLQQAKGLGKKIRRAVLASQISGWSIAVFGLLTLLGGLGSAPTFLLGLSMSVIAIVELKGSAALKRLDILAPQRLTVNQVALGIVLIAYAAWQLWSNLHSPGLLGDIPELAQSGLDVPGLERQVYLWIFLGIVLAAFVGPGLTAIYYATRRKHLDRYLKETPDWIVQLQRAGMEL